MAYKYQRSVVIVVVALFFNCHVVKAAEPFNLNIVDPSVIVNILDNILESRGTSLEQIHDKIASVRNDLEFVVNEINAQLGSNILRIVGEVVRLNAENVKGLLKDAIHVLVRQGFPGNPFMAAVVEATLVGQLEAQFQQVNAAIESIAIPVNTGENGEEGKTKRSLQPRAQDLCVAISSMVSNILQGQFTTVISDLLEIVKDILSQLYITTPSSDDIIGTVLAYVKNLLIDNVIEIITNLQESITVSAVTNSTESGIIVSTVLA